MSFLKEKLTVFFSGSFQKEQPLSFEELHPSEKNIAKNRLEIERLLKSTDFSSNEFAEFVELMILSLGGEREIVHKTTILQGQIFGNEDFSFYLHHQHPKNATIYPAYITVEDTKTGKILEEIKTGKLLYSKPYLTVYWPKNGQIAFEGEMFKEDARELAKVVYSVAFPDDDNGASLQ